MTYWEDLDTSGPDHVENEDEAGFGESWERTMPVIIAVAILGVAAVLAGLGLMIHWLTTAG